MQMSSCNFSVEQVELIRRLRNSGVTCQQLVEAFQALERIDARFGNTFNSPVSNNLQRATSNRNSFGAQTIGPPFGNETSALPNGRISPRASSSTVVLPVINYLPAALNLPGSVETSNSRLLSPITHGSSFYNRTSSQGSVSQAASNFTTSMRDGSAKFYSTSPIGHSEPAVSIETEHNSLSQSALVSGASPMKSQAADLTPDQCLILVQCSSEERVIDFVKKCFLSADFKPLQQAHDIGVSDSAMQTFLWGDVFSVDPSARRKLLEWIIGMCHHTDWFTQEMAKLLYFQGYGDGLDVQFTPRRERFTFRERHLDVLEAFWRVKQYPTFEEKEQIADECNYAMALEVQRNLDDKEKVTNVNVANWFKNKRKEIKRVTKKGEHSGETVKTFLDRLKPHATTTASAVGLSEPAILQERQQHGQENMLMSSIISQDALKTEPSSDPDSNSGTGTASRLTNTELQDNTMMEVVFPNYSNLTASYPVGQSASSLKASELANEATTVTDSCHSANSQGVVTLSPDSSSGTIHSLKTSEAAPTEARLLSSDLPAVTNTATATFSDDKFSGLSEHAPQETTTHSLDLKQELQ